ncbi:glycine-tRNA ligase [Flagelloscypha sp. PMI_526]|nr:glycine-tRNA ligase [Flagelloscypha sp. PMI_526]
MGIEKKPQFAVNKTAHPFDRARLEALLSRRFFYAPAFEIYGGEFEHAVAGLYDYGPPGSALQSNIISAWRKHFIIEEGMSELDTTIMTPAPVFETSGHVARFADFMSKDTVSGEVLRTDHLVKDVLNARLKSNALARGLTPQAEDPKAKKKRVKAADTLVKLEDAVVEKYESILAQLDNFTGPELGQIIVDNDIRNPVTGNKMAEPVQFNLMFASSIGPTGQHPGYLRPETAQGHFLNFSRLLDYNNGRVPFASACIGRSFRNEISPRAGLLRVREFTMAEIEHYVDPEDKSHIRFGEVKDTELVLLPRDVQESGSVQTTTITIGDAVAKGITLGYFMTRIYSFLLSIGIDPTRLRFRQHMANEMAHYATDCWDAEIENSVGGWTECVGCADRAAYDLSVHSKRTGQSLTVQKALDTPIVEEKLVGTLDKKVVGKTFKADAGALGKLIDEVSESELEKLQSGLLNGPVKVTIPGGKELELTAEMLKVEKKTFKKSVREFTPNVIEPSFGMGRILYALLEHSFWARESDIERGVLSFPPLVAPTKVLIVPLSSKSEFDPLVKEISAKFRRAGVHSRVDDSNVAIGRRYARNDELGTPFGVTVDFASLKNGTITVRERDTMLQLIGPINTVIDTVVELCEGQLAWADVLKVKTDLREYDGKQDVDV